MFSNHSSSLTTDTYIKYKILCFYIISNNNMLLFFFISLSLCFATSFSFPPSGSLPSLPSLQAMGGTLHSSSSPISMKSSSTRSCPREQKREKRQSIKCSLCTVPAWTQTLLMREELNHSLISYWKQVSRLKWSKSDVAVFLHNYIIFIIQIFSCYYNSLSPSLSS